MVFHHQVFQGNRSVVELVWEEWELTGCRATKTSPNLFAAFQTPCIPPLINLNVKISELPKLSHTWAEAHAFSAFNAPLSSRSSTLPPRLINLVTTPTVLSCQIHPGITGALLRAQIEAVPECKAVILSAYGSGNLPINPENGTLAALEEAVKREILVVVISQCE